MLYTLDELECLKIIKTEIDFTNHACIFKNQARNQSGQTFGRMDVLKVETPQNCDQL